jgi:hypothetical protein
MFGKKRAIFIEFDLTMGGKSGNEGNWIGGGSPEGKGCARSV